MPKEIQDQIDLPQQPKDSVELDNGRQQKDEMQTDQNDNEDDADATQTLESSQSQMLSS